MRNLLLMSTAATLLALPAWAQTEQPAAGQMNDQVAQQCLEDLQVLSQRMAEEGYWFTGHRQGWGWAGGGMAGQPMAGDPAVGAAPGDPAAAPGTAAEPGMAAGPGVGAGPWGATGWQVSPGREIHALQNAAAVLARQGDEEGCQYLLARVEQTYDNYAGQLREAGVEPGQISAWREEQIAASVPVQEMEHMLSLDNILGTEVRNFADESLGSIEDVVMAPETGEIAVAIISHGGFLGFGGEYAAVPWALLRTTPGFETFLLDATEETLENAPSVDPDQLRQREGFATATQDIEGYWQQHQQN
jgi:sporulation protein YlmC with PRC-barrel domain